MDKIKLLTELKAMANDVPDFNSYTPSSRVHLEWVGKVHALISTWNTSEAIYIKSYSGFLSPYLMRDNSVAQILGVLHRAIAQLELEGPTQLTQAFGAGEVYDFHKKLRELLGAANKSIFVVDPYLDNEIFDVYLAGKSPKVTVRLLSHKNASSLKQGLEKFNLQYKSNVEIRISNEIHDRVIFVDAEACWVLGQSIKDAAKSKPTYIVPLSSDVVKLKLVGYEQIWTKGAVL